MISVILFKPVLTHYRLNYKDLFSNGIAKREPSTKGKFYILIVQEYWPDEGKITFPKLGQQDMKEVFGS